jgi:hypothetical protein
MEWVDGPEGSATISAMQRRFFTEIPANCCICEQPTLPGTPVIYSFSKRGVASIAFDASDGISLKGARTMVQAAEPKSYESIL